jgi:PAS domain S-box-containing protein
MGTSRLSERENQMLQMAARGLTDQGIAHELGISVGTVGTYWGRVREKMGALSRSELVAKYVEGSVSERIETLRQENQHLAEQLTQASKLNADFHSLIQHAPDGVVFVDRHGNIIGGNEAAAELLGCEVTQFPGLRVGNFIPDSLHETHRAHREKYFSDPRRRKMGDHHGVIARKLDGSPIRIEATVSHAETQDGMVAIVFLRESPVSRDDNQLES